MPITQTTQITMHTQRGADYAVAAKQAQAEQQPHNRYCTIRITHTHIERDTHVHTDAHRIVPGNPLAK
jgi:translation elongation factor EF-Tu-like GTPase